MPLESATYVDDLVSTNPLGTDNASLGDDHIRLIKSVLKNTFPNLDGALTTKLAALNGVSQLITVGEDGTTLTFNFPSGGTVGNVTDWTSNQPVPASQADGRYLQRVSSANTNEDFAPTFAGINRSTGQIWLNYKDDKEVSQYAFAQPAGDYATNTALNTETTNRTNADTNLQNQIDNRVLKTGDTMTGQLNMQQAYVVGKGIWGGDLTTKGSNPWATQYTSQYNDSYKGHAIFCMRTLVGYYDYVSIQLGDALGGWDELQFRSNDHRLYTASGNKFALTSEIPSLPGNTLQIWHVDNVASMSTISFPRAFSSTPLGIWCQDMDGANVDNATIRNRTTTGFQVQTGGNNTRNITFFALGDI